MNNLMRYDKMGVEKVYCLAKKYMCNLSQGIEERAEKRAEERIILSMYDNGIDIEKIAVVSNRTVNEVWEIVDNKQAVLV
jgi:hypothetical protein